MSLLHKIFKVSVVSLLMSAGAATAQEFALPIPVQTDRDSREISVVVDKGLRSTRSLPTLSLRNARRAMFAGELVSDEDLRKLANYGDSLAALKYVDILMARGLNANASDIAYYGAIAVGGGRVWALPEMVEAMHLLDPKTEPKKRVNKYISVLYPHAWAGNSLALDAVVDFNGEGLLFGALSEATRLKIEAQAEANKDGRTELKQAISILRKPDLTQDELGRARALLERAQKTEHLAVSTMAANLIEQLAANHYGDAAQTN